MSTGCFLPGNRCHLPDRSARLEVLALQSDRLLSEEGGIGAEAQATVGAAAGRAGEQGAGRGIRKVSVAAGAGD